MKSIQIQRLILLLAPLIISLTMYYLIKFSSDYTLIILASTDWVQENELLVPENVLNDFKFPYWLPIVWGVVLFMFSFIPFFKKWLIRS